MEGIDQNSWKVGKGGFGWLVGRDVIVNCRVRASMRHWLELEIHALRFSHREDHWHRRYRLNQRRRPNELVALQQCVGKGGQGVEREAEALRPFPKVRGKFCVAGHSGV